MREKLARVNDGLARVEAWVAAALLIGVIVIASSQGILRNLSARFDIAWAREILLSLDWGDDYLKKATLWLALIGASIASHRRQHLAIDIIGQVVKRPLAKKIIRHITVIAAALICFALAVASYRSIIATNDALGGQAGYSVMDAEGMNVHICDASDRELVRSRNKKAADTLCCARDAQTHRAELGVLVVRRLN